MEQGWWNSDGRTVRWNSGTVFVEECGRIAEQCWWNSRTVMVEQCRWNSDGGTVRWNSGTVIYYHDLLHSETGGYRGLQGVTGDYKKMF